MKGKFAIGISFDSPSLAKLDALARSNGRTRSSMVRWLIQSAPHPFGGRVVGRSKSEVSDSLIEAAKDD
jgi:hypothetical protein